MNTTYTCPSTFITPFCTALLKRDLKAFLDATFADNTVHVNIPAFRFVQANPAFSLGQFHFEEVHLRFLVAFWDQTFNSFFPCHLKHLVKQSFDKHVLSLGKCFEQKEGTKGFQQKLGLIRHTNRKTCMLSRVHQSADPVCRVAVVGYSSRALYSRCKKRHGVTTVNGRTARKL